MKSRSDGCETKRGVLSPFVRSCSTYLVRVRVRVRVRVGVRVGVRARGWG